MFTVCDQTYNHSMVVGGRRKDHLEVWARVMDPDLVGLDLEDSRSISDEWKRVLVPLGVAYGVQSLPANSRKSFSVQSCWVRLDSYTSDDHRALVGARTGSSLGNESHYIIIGHLLGN